MDYKIQFFPEHQLVVEHIEGEITLEALKQKADDLFKNSEFDKGLCGAIDMRKAFTQMSKQELRDFAKLMNESETFTHSTWALIGNDPMVIALSQVFQKEIQDSGAIGVFGSVENAAKFLDKPELLGIVSD